MKSAHKTKITDTKTQVKGQKITVVPLFLHIHDLVLAANIFSQSAVSWLQFLIWGRGLVYTKGLQSRWCVNCSVSVCL